MSTLPNNIQKPLLGLKQIKPSSAWKQETHARLLQQLHIPQTTQRSSAFRYAEFVSAYSRELLTKLAWQPLGALALIAVVVVGPSVVTVNAAHGSLPGDALYPVKRSLERARISLTFSTTKRAELELNLVATRLHELQRITQEQAPSPERKQKIAIALEELKKDTSTVRTRLEAVKTDTQSATQKTDVVNLAKIIDEKTANYQQTLQAAVSDLHEGSETPNSDLGQAISTVQEVAIDALDVLVSNKESGDHPISQDELKAKVEQQLNVTKGSADGLKGRLTTLAALEAKATTEPAVATDTQTAPVLASDLMKKMESQIVPAVIYAEELLKLADFTSALDSLAKTNKQIEALSKQAQEIQDAAEVKEEPVKQEEPASDEPSEGAPAEEAPKEGSSEPAPSPAATSEQPSSEATPAPISQPAN